MSFKQTGEAKGERTFTYTAPTEEETMRNERMEKCADVLAGMSRKLYLEHIKITPDDSGVWQPLDGAQLDELAKLTKWWEMYTQDEQYRLLLISMNLGKEVHLFAREFASGHMSGETKNQQIVACTTMLAGLTRLLYLRYIQQHADENGLWLPLTSTQDDELCSLSNWWDSFGSENQKRLLEIGQALAQKIQGV